MINNFGALPFTLAFGITVTACPAIGQEVFTVTGSHYSITVNSELTVFANPGMDILFEGTPIRSLLANLVSTHQSYHTETAYALANAFPLLLFVAGPGSQLPDRDLVNGYSPLKRAAAGALRDIVEVGVPRLIELLRSAPDTPVRRASAAALRSINLARVNSALRFNGISANLSVTDDQVSQALGQWTSDETQRNEEHARTRQAYLLQRLEDSDLGDREFAVLQLARDDGEWAKKLLPDLIGIVQDDTVTYRQLMAIEIIGRLGVEGEAALPALTAATSHQDRSVRRAATTAMRNINRSLRAARSPR